MSARNTTITTTDGGQYPNDRIEVTVYDYGAVDLDAIADMPGRDRPVRAVLALTNSERKALRKALRKPKGK